MHNAMILIDLQKAFELLDHKILEKMACLGFKTPVIEWFESYPSNNSLVLWICFLRSWKLNFGLLQRFILGPLLFLKGVNDSINHYRKAALIFMLMMPVFSTKTKMSSKLKKF